LTKENEIASQPFLKAASQLCDVDNGIYGPL